MVLVFVRTTMALEARKILAMIIAHAKLQCSLQGLTCLANSVAIARGFSCDGRDRALYSLFLTHRAFLA